MTFTQHLIQPVKRIVRPIEAGTQYRQIVRRLKAVKTGRHMGVSRPILPPMPWPALAHLTDDDLQAIYAFLRTIPAVHNRVPDPAPPASAPGAPAGAPPTTKKP